ncbi:hypothetical protein [Candidatus Methylocalor cossyra]|uniref:Uncharacterized protein n=1 Tax=Candidatus Methylocalor cossyra TaxID=3108543 RepID=A0ABP1C965_9GAMM
MAAGPRRALSVQNLFLVTIVLKMAASLAAWWLGSPWLLGFAAPLGLMLGYIAVGLRRGAAACSDEQFADSCYYLGFIFTLSSILVALLDIPALATQLGEIAVRFGAAMVSTVLGLTVRVYLVTFRPTFQEAMERAEASLLEAVQSFRTRLELATAHLGEFQILVDEATRAAVARTGMALQTAADEHARRLAEDFAALMAGQRQVGAESAAHLQAATRTLSNALHDYAQTLVVGAERFEANATAFAAELEARLERAALPEDYFTARLQPAVAGLQEAVAAAGVELSALVSGLRHRGEALADALAGIEGQIAATAAALDRVRDASVERVETLARVPDPLTAWDRLTAAVATLEQGMAGALAGLRDLAPALRPVVEDTRRIAEAGQALGRLAEQHTALSAEVARDLARLLPRLEEADARISGHLNEAIHAFERSALKVAAAVTRQERAWAGLSERLARLGEGLAEDRPPHSGERGGAAGS